MRKFYYFLGAMAFASATNAQTTLPNAIYTLNFEGIENAEALGAELVGEGAFIKSEDANFGTYYQNNPNVIAGSHKNYLIVPTQGFINANAKNQEQFSIGMWINAYVANASTVSHYYSTVISAYSQTNSYKGFSWPMFSARERQTLQINCNGWSDYTNVENVKGANDESIQWSATKKYDSGEVDSLGNTIMVDKGFEDNWHYLAFTFNGINAKYYVDGELKNEWNATTNSYNFVKAMTALDALYLGDCGPYWQDQDASYAFDDINFYASELNVEQMELIMNIKRGNIGDAERLVIAQQQLYQNISDAQNYASQLETEGFTSLATKLYDYLIEEIGDYDSYETVEAVDGAIEKINKVRNGYADIVKAYEKANNIITFYTDYVNNTMYEGQAAFNENITVAKAAIANPESIEVINNAISTLESTKTAYIFSQKLTEGESINVTRMIDNPWFVEEENEPTLNADGSATYASENPGGNLNRGAWESYVSDNLRGATDCTTYYTQGRTTWNAFHSSTVANGVLDIHQTIKGLKAGYYTISADMVSSSAATDNHIYGTSNNITKVSPIFRGNGWDGVTAGVGSWETLTTDKVYVGEDGTLTIGATATTDGTAYKGWYCVTNFTLAYYGTNVDLSSDVADKKGEVESAIAGLKLKGDIANANAEMKAINESNETDYLKVSKYTTLLTTINNNIQKEEAFTALKNIEDLRDNAVNEVKKVYANGASYIKEVINSDTVTVDNLPALTALYVSYISYASAVKAATEWGTTSATTEVTNQINALATETPESLAENTAKLVNIMKKSISEFSASEAEPKDISGILVNASFNNDSHDGWTIESGSAANWYSECEFYNCNFNIYQTIEGLPAGSYRVTVQGFYRDGGRDTAVNNYNTIVTNEETGATSNAFTANAKLYANSRESDMMSLGADSIVGEENIAVSHPDGSSYAWYQPNGSTAEANAILSYPDGMNAAQYCFDKGMYNKNSIEIVISEGESLKFGIKKNKTINTDWTIFDNFKLYFLGTDIPTAITSAETPSASEPVAIYSVNGTRMNTLNKGINIIKMSDGSTKKIFKF